MIYLLDENFDALGTLEGFESLIWNDKYFECGDFEFHAPYALTDGAYIYDNVEEQTGVIEGIKKQRMRHVYTGRMLKCLLANKVISKQETYTNKTPEFIVKDLVKKYAGQDIQIEENQDRGKVTTVQVWGDNLMEFTDNLLKNDELGARIDYDYITGTLVYKVYEGPDNTDDAPLSKEFENINDYLYNRDIKEYKNFAYVKSNDETPIIVTVDRTNGEEKREIWLDGSVSKTYYDDDGTEHTMTDAEYREALRKEGEKRLDDYAILETIEIEPNSELEKLQMGEKRLFRDENYIAEQRVTERLMAYEDNRIKQSVVLGLQKLTRIEEVRREVKR